MVGKEIQRRMMVWLAIMALVVRVVAALVCHPPVSNTPSHVIDNVLGPIVICTSHGLQPLMDGGNDREPAQQSSIDHCPACALVQVFGLALLLAFSHVAFSLLRVVAGPWLAPRPLPRRLRLGAIQSRAPPARLSFV